MVTSAPPASQSTALTLVIGAGPAGATCALALAEAGLPSILVDDAVAAGGRIAPPGPTLPDLPGLDPRGAVLRRAIAAVPLIEHRTNTSFAGRFADGRVLLVGPAGPATLTPDTLILATGAIETVISAAGLGPALSLGGVQTLLKSAGVVPEGKVLLGGSGPLLLLVAVQLAMAGVEVVGVADLAPAPTLTLARGLAARPALALKALHWRWLLARLGVPIWYRSLVQSVADGAATIAALDAQGRVLTTRTCAADRVFLGHGLRPAIEAAQQAGCRIEHDPALGGWHVAVDALGATSVPGVFAIGEGAGIGGADMAQAAGVLLACHLAEAAGQTLPLRLARRRTRAQRLLVAGDRFRRALGAWSAWPAEIGQAIPDEAVVCACEGVTAGDLRASGYRAPAPVKLATRIGMGLCQGRSCAALAAAITGDLTPPAPRWPLVPVRAADLATLA